ncbi:MAG: membrane protein insertase YidC [Clostridium sp.]|nr:membrane protein insertase YidC [Clostridium sp.]
MSVLLGQIDHAARYQGFARYTAGDSTTVTLANEKVTLEISNKGGMISRAVLNEYKRYDSTAVELMAPDLGSYAFTLETANQRFDTDEFYFVPTERTDTSVTMTLDLGSGATWGLRYTLLPGSYCVRMDILQQNMQRILPQSTSEMYFHWNSLLQRNEAGRMFEERNSALYYKYAGGDVEHLSENKKDSEEINEKVRWIGFKNQFFSALMVAHNNFETAALRSDVLENNPDCLKTMSAEATFAYSPAKPDAATFVFYLGPNSYPILSSLEDEVVEGHDMDFTRIIPLGWSLFRWINTLIIIPVFTFLGKFISNYGIIILILTLFIKLILFPFTYKSYMSQAKMRVLAPEINELNEKYPGNENAMKRQQETMALYSRAGASPFSGCLPLLLQMPILVAMFNFFPSAIELRGESFLWAKDLSAPDAIWSWKTHIWLLSSTFGNHVSLFCLLMTVTNILYTRINMQSQPSGNTMPAMKWMMYLMPLMFLFWFNNYASGLSYYYFLSLLITIVQTYIFRKVVNEDKVRAQMRANARKPKKKSGFMARLEEAQRRQQAILREQEKQRQKGKR